MLLAVVIGVAVLYTTVSAPVATAVAMGAGDGTTVKVSAPPPGISITLSDAKAQTRPGATLTYTAAVTNAGAGALKGTLVVTIPAYSAFVGATAGHESGADIRWAITVGAGKSITKKVTVKLGTIPKGEVRFTTIATLYPAGTTTQILVRTADPDSIRGVVDPAHSVGLPPVTEARSNQAFILAIVILGAVVIVALVFLVWSGRRRRARGRGE
jgi:uncharacterized repeat protein (TIGR01451 family)